MSRPIPPFDPSLWPSAVAGLARAGAPPVDAVFDMDGTLLDGDIGDELVGWLWDRGHRPEAFRTRAPDLAAYRSATAGWTSADSYVLSGLISADLDPATLQEEARACLAARIPLRPPIVALAQELHRLGHRVWILTGSTEPLARVVAELLGLDPSLCIGLRFATAPETGRFTDRVVPPVTWGPGKVVAARTRIGRPPALALGDSRTDLPILRMATLSAVAVPPVGGALAELAREAGIALRMPADLGG